MNRERTESLSSLFSVHGSRFVYTPTTGVDSNGDAIAAMNPNGCALADVNTLRTGFVVNPDGSIDERGGRFFNTDLRITKNFPIYR